MDDGWADLVHDLTIDLRAMEHGQFVIVQHCDGLDLNPYVQAAPEGAGRWACEVVSGYHLPATVWPIDDWYLLAAGWTPPLNPEDNWSRTTDSPTAAAQILADGLRHGRGCLDWQPIIWQTARFPRPPDDKRDDAPVAPSPVLPGAGCRGRARARSARTRTANDRRGHSGTDIPHSLVR